MSCFFRKPQAVKLGMFWQAKKKTYTYKNRRKRKQQSGITTSVKHSEYLAFATRCTYASSNLSVPQIVAPA